MNKGKKIVLITFLIVLLTIFFMRFISFRLNEKIKKYSEIEATKLAKYVVNYAVKEELNGFEEELYIVQQSEENSDIKAIYFDIQKVNLFLNEVTNNVVRLFKQLERGESELIDLEQNLLTNSVVKGYKSGIVLEVPLGMLSNNFLFMNLGPKIPVKLSITGEIESNVSTSVVEYGINNALVTMYVNIEVSEQIIMPFETAKVTIKNQIPIVVKLIHGSIPNYYLNGIQATSALYSFPTF